MLDSDISDGVELLLTDSVVRHIGHLPSLPAVVMYLCQTTEEDDLDLLTLTQKLSLDPALTARTLKFANSALYCHTKEITTVRDAVMLLGFRTLRVLVMGNAIRVQFPHAESHAFDIDGFWRHTIATAVCCKLISQRLGRNSAHAFTAGMLHDIGCLVLVAEYPQDYEEVIERYRREGGLLAVSERETMGIDHVMVGTALAAHWHFPKLIQEAIAFHHNPTRAPQGSYAGIVHIGDALAHVMEGALKDDAMPERLDPELWGTTGLSEKDYFEVLEEGKEVFREIFSTLF